MNRLKLILFTLLALGVLSACRTGVMPQAGFTLGADPLTLTVTQGESVTTQVTVTRTGGFVGAVTLTLTGAPEGVTLENTSLPAGQTGVSATIRVAPEVAPGNYTLTLRGMSGSLMRDLPLTLRVSERLMEERFSISLNPDALSVPRGGEGRVTVTLLREAGFTGAVTVTLEGAPAGVVAREVTIPSGSDTVQLVVNVGTAVAVETFALRVQASGDTFISEAPLSLTVLERAPSATEVIVTITQVISSLMPVLEAAADDAGLIAFSQLPELLADPSCPDLGRIFATPFPGSVNIDLTPPPAADESLPRGTVTVDPATGLCTTMPTPGDRLVLNLRYRLNPELPAAGTAPARLEFIWAEGAPTVITRDRAVRNVEMPRNFRFLMQADGAEVADVRVVMAYSSDGGCGVGANPRYEICRVIANGRGSLAELQDVGFSLTESAIAGADRVQVGGLIALPTRTAPERVALTFAADLQGDLARDAQGRISSLDNAAGALSVSLRTTVATLGLSLNVSEFRQEESVLGFRVLLSDGVLTLGNFPVAEISGVLDDANNNGFPGDNVMIRFGRNINVTLESLLQILSISAQPQPQPLRFVPAQL